MFSETGNPAAKEVRAYADALKKGFVFVKQTGLFTNNSLLEVQAIVEQNNAGFRKLPGTKLLNDKTGAVIYTPPQESAEIEKLMKNLEKFINDDDISDLDPLVKMAVMHHQFESIHPFYDGNGRTGRILNILFLVLKGLLDLPVLYISRYIIKTKGEYYRLLQEVREKNNWEEWIIYMLNSVEETAISGIKIINGIKDLMQQYKRQIRAQFPRMYSQDLLNNLFKYPYTKIDFVRRDLNVSQRTAIRYLDALTDAGFLQKSKIGRDNFYLNEPLFSLLTTN